MLILKHRVVFLKFHSAFQTVLVVNPSKILLSAKAVSEKHGTRHLTQYTLSVPIQQLSTGPRKPEEARNFL